MFTQESIIQKDFEENIDTYRELDSIVYRKISDMLADKGFFVMGVSHRVKDPKSLKQKLMKKYGKYQSVYDITDLCGIRIICYFSDSVDAIADCIKDIFVVDVKNSIDKRTALQANQFGYVSLHCICSLKPEDGYDEQLCRIHFEVQIRTVLQHAWAEIEHDLGYKSEFGIPRTIIRDFSRVAGLLEVADEQFCNLRNNAERYSDEVHNMIIDGTADDIPLDMVTLNEFARNNRQFHEQLDIFSAKYDIEIVPCQIDKYLVQFDWLGIKNLGGLSNAFWENRKLIGFLIMTQLDDRDLNIITYGTFFRYLCFAQLISGNYEESEILKFHSLNYNEVRAKFYTEKTLEIRKKYFA